MTLHVIITCESREHPTSLVSAHVKHKFDTNVMEKVTTLFKNLVSCKFFLFLALRARLSPRFTEKRAGAHLVFRVTKGQ